MEIANLMFFPSPIHPYQFHLLSKEYINFTYFSIFFKIFSFNQKTFIFKIDHFLKIKSC
jgi:hypothetical protein